MSQDKTTAEKPKRGPEFDPETVRAISEAVYRDRLGESDVASNDHEGWRRRKETPRARREL